MSKVQEKRMEFVKELVELMESGKLEWSPGHDLPIHDLNVTTGKSYRGGNVLRLWKSARDQGFKDPRWMTFKQAKDKGYVLKKGSKGTWLEKYQPNTIKEVENKETGEKEAKVLPGFWKGFYVFNASQFENVSALDIPQYTHEERNALMEGMIERSEAPVIIDQTNKNYYMPSEDKIHVMSPEQYKDITRWYATIAHEIGHSTGHPSRLDRKAGMESRFGQPEYAKEELRAELTAAMIGKEFGLPMDEIQKKTHAAYLQNWIRILKNDPNELFRAANDAQEAVEYIREHMMDKTLLKNLNEEMILPDISKEKGTEITNKELAIERVNQNPWSLKYVSEELSKDMHVVIPAVIKEPLTLQFAHPLLRESAEVVTNATARKAEALQFAAGSFKEDSEFMEWLVHEQPLALEYAAINVRNNFTVVLAAVNKDIHALEYAGKDITADKEIMEFFVQRNGMALEYASDELKNDKDLVQKAMIQNPEAFQYATQSLRNNKKFVMDTMNTVNDNTFVWIRHAGSLIQNDPDIWALEASIQDHGRPQPVRIDSKEVTVDHLPQPEVPKEAIKTLETKRQEKKRPGINFGQAQGKGLER